MSQKEFFAGPAIQQRKIKVATEKQAEMNANNLLYGDSLSIRGWQGRVMPIIRIDP